MATYLLRYDGVSLSVAGLTVGAATVVGGIGGTVLGSKVRSCSHFDGIIDSQMLIPSKGGRLLQNSRNKCLFYRARSVQCSRYDPNDIITLFFALMP